MTPSKPWKSSQFSRKIVRKLASYAIYIMITRFVISKHQITIMDGETEPERRYRHVAVRVEHYLLLFGGEWRDKGQDLQIFPANVIWMYNLYTEQWKKNILPTKESPHAIRGTHAEVIESVVYMFGGSNVIFSVHTTNAL